MNIMNELDLLKRDYDIENHVEKPVKIPSRPESGLVLVVGSSGSGKSTIIKNWFGEIEEPVFSDAPVIENFSSISKGQELLKAVGLRSIPTWFRPFRTLSNGEKHRALCALMIDNGHYVFDEFTSVVDRDTAKSLSATLRKWHKDGLMVVATCHRDVEEWLCPDVIYDTDLQDFTSRRYLCRPPVNLSIRPASKSDWVYFKKHHYLSDELSSSCHCYIGYVNDKPVAFNAVIHGTGRDIKSYWRSSRLVVVPEFQGLGIGVSMSEAIALEYVTRGKRFFAKTANSLLGQYRDKHPEKWRPTSTNHMDRPSYLVNGEPRKKVLYGKTRQSALRDAVRVCYSHEYIAKPKQDINQQGNTNE
jgi:ABC-type lipoprotein export system ATPase subunit/GNAT superfamily N-acetyltransferase